MTILNSYRDLIVWQRAMQLVEEVYLLTNLFPKNELYGITSQIRRSAVFVPSNIAEGYGRKSSGDFGHHLSIAYGSLLELETQLLLSKKLKYAIFDKFIKAESLLTEVSKMLNTMLIKFRNKTKR